MQAAITSLIARFAREGQIMNLRNKNAFWLLWGILQAGRQRFRSCGNGCDRSLIANINISSVQVGNFLPKPLFDWDQLIGGVVDVALAADRRRLRKCCL
jgi:hypothetical protein